MIAFKQVLKYIFFKLYSKLFKISKSLTHSVSRIKNYQRSKTTNVPNNTQRDSREINANNRQLAQWRSQPERTSSLETVRTTDGERSLRSNKSVNVNPQ